LSRFSGVSDRTFSSLKVRNYRIYFIGQMISMCGTWMQSVGQAWLVLKLTGSGTALGLVTALQFLPVLLLGPFAGVVVDRMPKRRVLRITQSIAGLLALLLAVLVSTGSVRLWQVYAVAVGFGLVATLDIPTRQIFVLELVGKDDLNNAVTLNAVMVNTARVIGPAMAGALIAVFGLAVCFYINAASFLAVLAALAMIDATKLTVTAPAVRRKGQLREGLRYVRSTPVLRDALVMMAIVGTLSYEFQVILPLVARYTFDGTAATYSALTAAMGAGAVIGGLMTAGRRHSGAAGLVRAAGIFGVTILVAAAAPNLAIELAAMVVVGAASVMFLALGTTTLQLEAAPEMRGRVMALWSVAFLGSTPIGGPIVGFVGQHAGPRWGLVLGGVAALVAGAIGFNTLRGHRAAAIDATPERVTIDRPAPPVVTLSASYGAGGSVVGPLVAQELAVPFLDRAIPAAVAELLTVSPGLALAHDERPPAPIGVLIARLATANIPDGATPPPSTDSGVNEEELFLERTEQVLHRFAASGAVILGRAAAIVLAEHPRAFHVRLDAPPLARLARVAAEQHVDDHAAAALVADNDRAREAYVHHFYGTDPNDPALYDLTIDTTSVSIPDTVNLIVAGVRAQRADPAPRREG
jgi:MFS family permease